MPIPIDVFPEVPLEIVEASGWVDVASGRWRYRDENIIVLESRAPTRGVEILASTQQLYRKRCVALVDNMAAALSFERRRSRKFLVMTCFRRLAGLCLALDLVVTVRWIPSEINVSDRPSHIHDPSDNRDNTMTDLLTTVVDRRTHRDKFDAEMMAQGDPQSLHDSKSKWGIACEHFLKRSANIAPLKPRRVRRHLRGNKARRSPTLRRTEPLTSNSKTTADEENAGDWSERDSDGTSSTDGDVETKRKQTRLEQSALGRARAIEKAGEDPTLACPSSEEYQSVTQPKQSTERAWSNSEEKLALVADDEVDATFVQDLNMSYSQGRPVSDGEVLFSGASLLPTSVRKARWTKTLSIMESPDGLEKESSDKVKATTAKNDLVWSLLGNGEEQETFDGHPRLDDDRDVMPTWRTLAVDARGPDQTSDWSLLLHPVQRGESSCKKGSSSTDTRTSPKSFEELHVQWS